MFEPIAQNLSLRDQIVQDILAKIEQGAISVGDRLPPERDLAISFNVSRTTVRDALRTLVGLG
ncbi:MAG: winged helix-turn-helix domain-containing protein, partial [Firmicutes bacterium]|nr:winged helix-turn-helix domain-containing protein [Bacillota bacterium]